MSNCSKFKPPAKRSKDEVTYAFGTQAHYFQMTGCRDCDELGDLLLRKTYFSTQISTRIVKEFANGCLLLTHT